MLNMLHNKLIQRGYDISLLSKQFLRFQCQYSDEIMKFGVDQYDLLKFCLNYKPKVVTAESVPSKPEMTTCLHSSIPSPLKNFGNTCYINCVLQFLLRVGQEFSFDNFVQQLIIVDKNDNADAKICLVFYKYLYLAHINKISSEDLLDFVQILESVNPFFQSISST